MTVGTEIGIIRLTSKREEATGENVETGEKGEIGEIEGIEEIGEIETEMSGEEVIGKTEEGTGEIEARGETGGTGIETGTAGEIATVAITMIAGSERSLSALPRRRRKRRRK
jgi:hypothetical protein